MVVGLGGASRVHEAHVHDGQARRQRCHRLMETEFKMIMELDGLGVRVNEHLPQETLS